MNYENVEEFKAIVEGFMKHHKLIGVEMLLPYHTDMPVFRACGKGMVHPKCTSLEGVELWEGLNDILKKGDKARVRRRTTD